MSFIDEIAKYVQTYSLQYGINVCSPIIAQAVLESASGTSELAVNAHNYFGLKYKASVAKDFYIKVGSEQNPDGSYTSSVMKWCKFDSLEAGVKGYFDFISAARYANLKGISDPLTYLETIKADGYATSHKYVGNVYAVIQKYDLTKYDLSEEKGSGKMRINVHAGHNPDGKVACGAVGLIKESTEARLVKDKVIAKLKTLGHSVYDCTVDNGKNQSDVLKKIIAKTDEHSVDLDVSIHFNAGASDKAGNGSTTGTEVLVYSKTSDSYTYAKNICNEIASLGFKNRGVKTNTGLYVLKHTIAPALLIECCFVDDADDVALYDAEKMANAIVKGITGQTVKEAVKEPSNVEEGGGLYHVQVGAYSFKANAEKKKEEIEKAGFDAFIVYY